MYLTLIIKNFYQVKLACSVILYPVSLDLFLHGFLASLATPPQGVLEDWNKRWGKAVLLFRIRTFPKKIIFRFTYCRESSFCSPSSVVDPDPGSGASVPVSTFMCLYAIYIFPGSVCLKNQHVAVKNVKCIIFYPISSWPTHYTELPRFTPEPPHPLPTLFPILFHPLSVQESRLLPSHYWLCRQNYAA